MTQDARELQDVSGLPGEVKLPGGAAMILLEETDALLPRHWVAGSGKYTDFEPLTAGGTAELFTCIDNNLHRVVVFKRLHEDLRDSEMETKRFLREARVTGMIAHPGTVPVYEVGRDREGALYFTMKHLVGRDLRSVIEGLQGKDREVEAAYPLPILVDVLVSVCQTVAYAHRQGVIHRDLKPANILAGAFGEVTVLDWGLAKVRGERATAAVELPDVVTEVAQELSGSQRRAEAEDMGLTQRGKRYGTPLYMSPEQARGDEVDERTDVFNLGSILYEFLTLKNLVWGKEVSEVLEQVLKRPTPRPSNHAVPGREVPPELEAICLRALQKEPGKRYASMEALAADLVDYRAGHDVSVVRYGWWHTVLRWRLRHQLAVAMMLAAGLGALGMWVVKSIFDF